MQAKVCIFGYITEVKMKAYERLIKYAKYNTVSSETSGAHPSTESQWTLAKELEAELISLGCTNVRISDTCYVYAEVPATEGYENAKKLGFIAHMDTSPSFSGEGVNPQIVKNYDGGELTLGESGRVLSPKMFPHLTSLKGRTLIVTDGRTLLGADDKAGIAEIMTMLEELRTGNIAHGPLRVAFTPDEEIGEGADHFDVSGFDADFAYTLDGGEEGSMEYENFNAAGAEFTVHGVNVHPGSAKDVMVNAALVAVEIASMLPTLETPAHTENYEGFFHLTDMKADVESAKLSYIVRDHDASVFDSRILTLRHIEKVLNERYGKGTVELTVREQYRNMREKLEDHMHLIENAKLAAERAGLTPVTMPIRGGTDGARLSYMGLPCPNLGTGGYAFHGPYEHISIEGMEGALNMIKEIVKIYSAR